MKYRFLSLLLFSSIALGQSAATPCYLSGSSTACFKPINIASGGTGSITSQAAINALSQLTTKGDIEVYNGTNTTRLPVQANGSVLTASSGAVTGLQWLSPAPTGVTSVGFADSGGIFSHSGAPITGSGTITTSVTGTSGGIPYFNSTSQLSSSTSLTANGVIYGMGAGLGPSATNAGTSSQVLIGGSPPIFGNVPTAAIPASLANGTIGGYTPGAQAGATPSSSPSAGNVGENLTAYGTSISLNTSSFVSVAKVTLTPGLWSCMGVYWNNNSATQTGSTGKIFFENVNNSAFGLDEMTIAGGAATGGTVSFPTLFYIVKSGDADKSYDMEAKSTTAAGNAYGTVSCLRIN